MAANVNNFDVKINSNSRNAPSCPHGPTLLFSKFDKIKGVRNFYACSACRDRKDCSFFQWEDEIVTEKKKEARKRHNQSCQPPFTHKGFQERLQRFKRLSEDERAVCHTCGLLLLAGEKKDHQNQGHLCQTHISLNLLAKPTKLFHPNVNSKTYAQYLFSEVTVEFILQTLKTLDVTHILCVGAPRIHELIQSKKYAEHNFHSLMLDIDYRYEQIYTEETFCRYNMFTHYFFDEGQGMTVFNKFLECSSGKDKKLALLIDPPFGGMVGALGATINKIITSYKDLMASDPAVLLFFPYFMEKHIVESLPEFKMLDYKVDYDNHALYKNKETKKKGSPVRIFTNVPPVDIYLPVKDGYWYCDRCVRYSSAENKHCEICDSCTSKDGRSYVHCFKCGRCVKPERIHCSKCKSCQLTDHSCDIRKQEGCHMCGDEGHKRKQCPLKLQSSPKRKKSKPST